jgi:hypothetical protein
VREIPEFKTKSRVRTTGPRKPTHPCLLTDAWESSASLSSSFSLTISRRFIAPLTPESKKESILHALQALWKKTDKQETKKHSTFLNSKPFYSIHNRIISSPSFGSSMLNAFSMDHLLCIHSTALRRKQKNPLTQASIHQSE